MDNRLSDSLPHGYHLKGDINEYIIDRVLGQGAFGITYLARYRTTIQGTMGRGSGWTQVAVKEFFMKDMNSRDGSTGYLNDASQDSLIGRYRCAFMREARNLAGLHHDNIVNVFEVIETNNTVYIVMEYINGGSLDDHIAQSGHLSEHETIDKMLKLCSAVGCLHDNKMLHLDIKPKNVMLDEDGELYLIDFGLSKQYTADGEPESSTSIGLGTPGYAPGEQAVHQDGDKKFRATLDIYALGATFFKMLTGKTPPNASQVSDSTLDGDNIIPKLLKESGASDGIVNVVTKAMWPSSSKRYQNVDELESAIDALLDGTITENTVHEEPKPKLRPKLESRHQSKSNPRPEPSAKPVRSLHAGLPKWLYGMAAALVVGLMVFLAIPISKHVGYIPVPEKPVQEQVVTPALTPNREPDPESGPIVVEVTSITLNKKELTLEEGATSTFTVKYTPTDATDKNTTWSSTNTMVAAVNSNGKVTAIKAGSAAIIARCGAKEAYCNIIVNAKPQITATGINNGHEYVDLGLSVKWATCNIGASKSESYGDYYAWGETKTKSTYNLSTYKYYNGLVDKQTKYITSISYGTVDNKTTLEMSDDVARQKWGGSWRMPTEKEFHELIDSCIWKWTTQNGVNGYNITSKKSGFSNLSIFLPAAGNSDFGAGSSGYYWSSSLFTVSSSSACQLYFDSDLRRTGGVNRSCGFSVRPICK